MNDCLKIKNLTVQYGRFKALENISFSVPKGSVCAFVGANGAGKTTTFSTIAGFIRPLKGEIEINGESLHSYRRSGHMIGLLPQDVSFFEHRSVFSQLNLMARLSGLSSKDAKTDVRDVLEQLGLSDKASKKPSQLSRGMLVRMGIAQAIVGKPPLILLDEPTAGLDPLRRNEFYELISELRGDVTIMISSHQLAELEELCDHLVIIDEGKIIKNNSMNNFLKQGRKIRYVLSTPVLNSQSLIDHCSEFDIEIQNEQCEFFASLKDDSLRVEDMNKKILSWLIHENIGIMEVHQKKSLNEFYLKEIKA